MACAEPTTLGKGDAQSEPSTTAQDAPLKSRDKPITMPQVCMMFAAVCLPNFLAVFLLSDIGVGLQVYSFTASTKFSIAGDGCVFLATLSMASLYVIDWFFWKNKLGQAIAGAVPIILLFIGAFLKGRKYPFAPLLYILFSIPVLLGGIRASLCSCTSRKAFYKTVGQATGFCAITVFTVWILWMFVGGNTWDRDTKDRLVKGSESVYKYIYTGKELNYLSDCHPELQDLSQYTKTEKPDIVKACGKAASVWFLVWVSPLVAVICCAVMSVFSFVHGMMMATADQSEIIRALWQFMVGLMFLFAGMYCSISMTSLVMSTTIMAFMAAGVCILVIWTFLEVGPDALKSIVGQSKFANMLLKAWRSDWIRAIAVIGVNMAIPMYLLLNMMTQKVRKCRGKTKHQGAYTEQFQGYIVDMADWNWASILTKVALLSELYFTLNVGVQKATYIFLSWLGDQLEPVPFAAVVVMVFAIGWCMFLLPPVPGVPVYVFSGIVLADQARRNLSDKDPITGEPTGESGFIIGCGIAIVVGFVNKLCACCGQYCIGYNLGKSVKVQQLVKVDSILTRAIESILRRPGLNIGKVAVLIGGPDWPVSVGCGLIRLSIPQMLIGTSPVLIILTPCVLAGAFIARQGSGGEDSVFPMLANLFLVFMLVAQVSAGLIALLAIMMEAQNNEEELSKSRPEHAAVEELTRKEEYYNTTYKDSTLWRNMTFCDKAILLCMVISHAIAEFTFVMMGTSCFLPFSVDKKIATPIEEGGLGGNPFSIILFPMGAGAVGIFFFGVVLHIYFLNAMGRRVGRKVKANPKPVEANAGFDYAPQIMEEI